MSETEIIPVPFEFVADDEGATAYHPVFDRIIIRDGGDCVFIILRRGEEKISHEVPADVARAIAGKLSDVAAAVSARSTS